MRVIAAHVDTRGEMQRGTLCARGNLTSMTPQMREDERRAQSCDDHRRANMRQLYMYSAQFDQRMLYVRCGGVSKRITFLAAEFPLRRSLA
jgi:hypothetical protein